MGSGDWIEANPFAPPDLIGTGVHVWRVDVPLSPAWEDVPLTEQDLRRAEDFSHPGKAAEFRRLRGWLRTLLGGYAGAGAARREFHFGPHGKPALPDAHLHFNLSHCLDQALLAVCRCAPVGVDVERRDRRVRVAGMAARYFHPAERARLVAAGSRPAEFMRIWTAKEALLKALGCGISVSLEDTDSGAPPPGMRIEPVPLPPAWAGGLAHSGGSVRYFQTPRASPAQ